MGERPEDGEGAIRVRVRVSGAIRNGDIYVGDWVQDKMHGKGKFTSRDGNVFVGEFKNHRYVAK